MKIGKFLIFSLGITSALPRLAHGHSLATFVVGDNPEKRVIAVASKEDQAILDAATQNLATRLATLSLCAASQAYKGSDPSTLKWYTATALSQWNDEILTTFSPSTELNFDHDVFEKAYKAELNRRLNLKNLPRAFSRHSEDFAMVVAALTESTLPRNKKLGTSTSSLNLLTLAAKQKLLSNLSEVHEVARRNPIPCSDVKKGSKFWARYSFFSSTRPVHRELTLEKTENIIEKILPGGSVEKSTQNLIDTAYGGSFIYRNSARENVGKKDDSKSLRRCGMYVSIALAEAGCTGTFRSPDGIAQTMGEVLVKKFKFENLMVDGEFPRGIRSINDVPPGAVLVYSGGGAGHAEIKTRYGVVSDYYSSNPRTGTSGKIHGNGRTLTGIYIKPSCGAGRRL